MDNLKYLSRPELTALLRVAEGEDRLIVLVLYDAGMRVGELVTTRISDIDFKNGWISIQSYRSKTKAFRAARVCQEVLEVIKSSVEPGQVWLLPGRSNGHLCKRTVQYRIGTLAKEAGIQASLKNGRHKVTPHSFRHSHIVDALTEGIPVNVVQQQVGHKSLASTQAYSKVAPVFIRDVYISRGFGNGLI
jgi:integrase/recombinase XerD